MRQGREGVEDMQISVVGILKKWKSMRKFQGSIKKEVDFLGVINWSGKNRVISMGLCFWSCWNFQAKERVYDNFAEFFGINPFSLEFTIFKSIVTSLKSPWFFQKCPPVLDNFPCLDFFSGITQSTRYPSVNVTDSFESAQSH